jgi:hypothetical protein
MFDRFPAFLSGLKRHPITLHMNEKRQYMQESKGKFTETDAVMITYLR